MTIGIKIALGLLITLRIFPGDNNPESHVISNTESVKLKVYYVLGGAAIPAGEALLQGRFDSLNNLPVYHLYGTGKTLPFYDRFFKVRDSYETFIDTLSMQPYLFIRKVSEGSFKKFEKVTFNNKTNVAVTNAGVFRMPEKVHDIMSAMYYARNIKYEMYQPNDTISFNVFMDNELFKMYVRYVGKETITTSYGKVSAIKLKPLLLKGSAFTGGEKMNVWISDDKNRIPIRIETEINVGHLIAEVTSVQNLRFPLAVQN